MKKLLFLAVKLLIMAAILFYLFSQAVQNKAFEELAQRPKHWGMLSVAFFCHLSAVFITFFRWRYLARTLDVDVKNRDSVQVGFIGFLFNLAPLGIVGGDLVRSLILFRRFPSHKTKILASIVLDRIVGLYAMFLLALMAVYVTGFNSFRNSLAQSVTTALWLIVIVSTLSLLAVLIFGSTRWMLRFVEKIPKIGHFLHEIVLAIRTYRHHQVQVFLSIVMTFPVHILFSVGIWCIATALYGSVPSVWDHFVLHPVANITSMIPLPLGPYEYVLDRLYPMMQVSEGQPLQSGYGLVIALVYRLISLLIGCFSLVFYFSGRSEVRQVMQNAQNTEY